MKKYLYFIWTFALVAILLVTGFFVTQKIIVPKEIHIHAGFVVFENNKKVDFSDLKYMSVEPCGKNHKENPTEAEIQDQKAHLHDSVGNVLHSHREGAVWRDLFANIKYSIDYGKVTGHINGQQIGNWENQGINEYDSLVVFIGENDGKHLDESVKKEHIQEIEKKSENCGT